MKLDLEKALTFMVHMNKELSEEMNRTTYDPVEIIELYGDDVFERYGITKESLVGWYIERHKNDIIESAKSKLSDSELFVLGLIR